MMFAEAPMYPFYIAYFNLQCDCLKKWGCSRKIQISRFGCLMVNNNMQNLRKISMTKKQRDVSSGLTKRANIEHSVTVLRNSFIFIFLLCCHFLFRWVWCFWLILSERPRMTRQRIQWIGSIYYWKWILHIFHINVICRFLFCTFRLVSDAQRKYCCTRSLGIWVEKQLFESIKLRIMSNDRMICLEFKLFPVVDWISCATYFFWCCLFSIHRRFMFGFLECDAMRIHIFRY